VRRKHRIGFSWRRTARSSRSSVVVGFETFIGEGLWVSARNTPFAGVVSKVSQLPPFYSSPLVSRSGSIVIH
jgi:hypothetical protein